MGVFGNGLQLFLIITRTWYQLSFLLGKLIFLFIFMEVTHMELGIQPISLTRSIRSLYVTLFLELRDTYRYRCSWVLRTLLFRVLAAEQ
jgi:hypothetical protein